MTCHLYIIAHVVCGKLAKPVKVGITEKPQSRLNSLRTGNPCPLDFAFVFNLPDKPTARSLENAFHSMHALSRMSGEWFDLNPIKVIQLVCAYLGVIMTLNLDEEHFDAFSEATRLKEAELLIAHAEGAIH